MAFHWVGLFPRSVLSSVEGGNSSQGRKPIALKNASIMRGSAWEGSGGGEREREEEREGGREAGATLRSDIGGAGD